MRSLAWNNTYWKPRFFTIWGGQAVSLFGSQLVQFALVWWLTEETGSATVLATATLIAFLPQVVLGPLIGTLIDRWDRRLTMIYADAVIALATVLLAYLFYADLVTIHWIYVLLFVRSLGGGFHGPAMIASTSLMVPEENLTRIQGLNQMLQGALGIVAAPMGALAVAFLSTHTILMIDVVTALVAIVPLLVFLIPRPPVKTLTNGDVVKTSFWEDFRAGFAYMLAWPGLLMVLLLAVMLNFIMTPTGALQPLLITDHFNKGAAELGWMQSSFGAGMLAGGILLGIWGGFKKRIKTSLTGIVLMGFFFSFLGLLPENGFVPALAVSFMGSMMLPFINGPLRAILQSAVEPEMQGRVFTLVQSMASGMAPLGLLLAGPLADAYGVRFWFVTAGVVSMLTGVVGFFIPAVLAVEENRKHQPTPPDATLNAESSTVGSSG